MIISKYKVISFHKKFFTLFKLYKSRKLWQYHLPVLLGIIYKLNSITLFIIPIQAIKSVSERSLSLNIKNILDSLRLPIPPDAYIYQFFLISILFALISLISIKKLKNNCILNIKKRLIYKYENLRKLNLNNEFYDLNEKSKEIENFIENSENILFCFILSIFIVIYDLQIALILFLGGLLYFFIFQSLEKDLKKKRKMSFSEDLEKNSSNYKQFLSTNSEDNKDLIKAFTSTIVMLIIMTAVYSRIDSSISIIFIFLIRIFQNNMLNSIRDFIKNYKNN
tara:strand:- start:3238 stop:4077 length:840 start_codon:yes stop_codon:yes gene_type:complete